MGYIHLEAIENIWQLMIQVAGMMGHPMEADVWNANFKFASRTRNSCASSQIDNLTRQAMCEVANNRMLAAVFDINQTLFDFNQTWRQMKIKHHNTKSRDGGWTDFLGISNLSQTLIRPIWYTLIRFGIIWNLKLKPIWIWDLSLEYLLPKLGSNFLIK